MLWFYNELTSSWQPLCIIMEADHQKGQGRIRGLGLTILPTIFLERLKAKLMVSNQLFHEERLCNEASTVKAFQGDSAHRAST